MWDQLSRTITLSDGTRQLLSGYLDGPASNSDPDAADLYEFRAAVATLAGVSSAEALERNLRQAIDSTSHRLDVWITEVAHGRLTSLRRSNPSGVLIGGYGWVENLRLRSSSLESDGFIHAPSVPQAVSAAVLRSGYQSLSGGASNPFAVNLSSARSRLASRLLDRVRAGQTVGALTGDEFERNIQESGAGQYTRAFRECAPSSTTFPAGGGPPATIPQPPRLTDGLVLRDKWQAGDSQVAALLAQIESDDQQRRQNGQPALAPVVTVALGMLEDAIDAVADALTAESVHHAIAGPRSGDARRAPLARGDGSVPELDFLTSPRHRLTLGHRVAFAVPANVGRQPGWSAPSSNQSRAAANPTLEGWSRAGCPIRARCAAPHRHTRQRHGANRRRPPQRLRSERAGLPVRDAHGPDGQRIGRCP